jgi:hypothetical protein
MAYNLHKLHKQSLLDLVSGPITVQTEFSSRGSTRYYQKKPTEPIIVLKSGMTEIIQSDHIYKEEELKPVLEYLTFCNFDGCLELELINGEPYVYSVWVFQYHSGLRVNFLVLWDIPVVGEQFVHNFKPNFFKIPECRFANSSDTAESGYRIITLNPLEQY